MFFGRRSGVGPAGGIVQSKRERIFAQVEGRCPKRRVLRPVRFWAEALCILEGKAGVHMLDALTQAVRDALQNFGNDFYVNFIKDDRWHYLANGLIVTLEIALMAIIIGVVLGALTAMVRTTHDKAGGMGFLNAVCKVYVTFIRGTPVVVQLLILYFIVFTSPAVSKVTVAVLAFGINSGAYLAEIFRSGIMSIDGGQFEAGRCLGLSHAQTMRRIILPQAFKNVLPALGNEFIALVKETSVAGYIAIVDLTKGGDIIRGLTFSAFMPLFAVALLYLGIVSLLSFGVTRLERRLRESER